MSNPYEFFAASDDEDSKPTLVKTDNKPKRSNRTHMQLTKKKDSSNNSRIRTARKQQKPGGPSPPNPSPKKSRNLTNIPTWRGPRKSGKRNSAKDTISIADRAPAESTYHLTQGPTQESRRRLRQRRKR